VRWRVRALIWALLWLSVDPLLTDATAAEPRSVLVLIQSSSVSPWSHRVAAEYVAALNRLMSPAPTIYVEFLDVGRFDAQEYDAFFKDSMQRKYQDKRVGVVVPIGSVALAILMRNRPDSLSGVPVVFTVFDAREGAQASRIANATGTILPVSFYPFVVAARAVVPGLKRIVHVGDAFERQPYRNHFAAEIRDISTELEIVDLAGLPLEEIKQRVAALPDDTVIAYTAMYSDNAGGHYDIHAVLRTLVEVANRPIVFDNATFIGLGTVGGFLAEPEDIARDSARLAARILAGEAPAVIPVETHNLLRPVFDARELRRWHVSDSRLPPGSDIRFRAASAWDMYRWQIVAVTAGFVFLGALIVWLLTERYRRRKAEMEAHLRFSQAAQMNRALTVGTMSASIGHELRQPLAAIMCNAEAADMMLSSGAADVDEVRQILADIRRDDHHASEIISRLRNLLRGDDIERATVDVNKLIVQTIDMLTPEARGRGVDLVFERGPDLAQCRGNATQLQQVLLNLAINAMEAMRDCTRERRLVFRTEIVNDAQLTVCVSDTGSGIPSDMLKQIFEPLVTTKPKGTGLGLAIVHSIVETHGGTIWAENRSGGGAAFHFTLPRVAEYFVA
jgi:signal transduction histidine kinase